MWMEEMELRQTIINACHIVGTFMVTTKNPFMTLIYFIINDLDGDKFSCKQ